jgi:FKBP-type peptidyl-prolyl cis-trans isomerase
MKLTWFLLACLTSGCGRATPAASTAATAPAGAGAAAGSDATPRTIDRGDGCVVEVTQEGAGCEAHVGDEVLVAYDAHVKDAEATIASTRGWDEPCRFRIGEPGTIRGLSRGLEGVREGSKVRIEVPPALGYGKDGCPGSNVPADATLVFEVELLGVR